MALPRTVTLALTGALVLGSNACSSPFPTGISELQSSGATAQAPASGGCETGSQQSPIALSAVTAVSDDATAPTLRIPETATSGFSIAAEGIGKVVISSGRPYAEYDGVSYALTEVEYRAAAEHVIDATRHPIELQFRFTASSERTLILALFGEEGRESEPLRSLVTGVDRGLYGVSFSLADIVPNDAEYLSYEGSLTTAPCSEGVRWIVLTEPVEFSAAQLQTLTDGHSRGPRPLQAAEGRESLAGSVLIR